MGYICDALLDNTGLISLVVWNNNISQESSPALVKVLVTILEPYDINFLSSRQQETTIIFRQLIRLCKRLIWATTN